MILYFIWSIIMMHEQPCLGTRTRCWLVCINWNFLRAEAQAWQEQEFGTVLSVHHSGWLVSWSLSQCGRVLVSCRQQLDGTQWHCTSTWKCMCVGWTSIFLYKIRLLQALWHYSTDLHVGHRLEWWNALKITIIIMILTVPAQQEQMNKVFI